MASDWRERKKKELRKMLYEKAVELFGAKGYEETTVQQITEAVGVAKGTFFNHFPSKEHVIVEWYHGITVTSLEAARDRDLKSAEEAICELFEDMARRATDAPELLIAKSRNSTHVLLVSAEQTQEEEIVTFIVQQCQSGQTGGEIAETLDVHFFASLLGSVLTGTSRAWVLQQPRFDFPRVIRERAHFLFCAAKTAQQ